MTLACEDAFSKLVEVFTVAEAYLEAEVWSDFEYFGQDIEDFEVEVQAIF